MILKVGDTAPNFALASTSGKIVELYSEFKGKKPLILFFYPKDFTPGCTKEACSFRDNFEEFKGLDIEVYGVSKDSMASHIQFKNKHDLPFELLSDHDGKVCKNYKALMPILGVVKRVTYFINKDMIIEGVYESMTNPRTHIEKMLEKANS